MKNETNKLAETPPCRVGDISGSSSFVCLGCKCEVPKDYSVKTDGYCYLCDPKVTLDECLQDEYPKSWR